MAKYNFSTFIDEKSVIDGFEKMKKNLIEIDKVIKDISKTKGFSGEDLKAYTQALNDLNNKEKEHLDLEIKAEKLREQKAKSDKAELELTKKKTVEKQKLTKEEKAAGNEAKKRNAEQLRSQKISDKIIQKQQKRVENTRKLNDAYKKESARLNTLRAELKSMLITEGEASVKTKKLANEVQHLDAKLKAVDAKAGQFQRFVGNYGLALKNLKNSFMSIAGSLGMAGGIAGAVTGFMRILKNASGIVMSFEKQVSQLAAISKATPTEIKALSEQAKYLGATSSFTASQILELDTELAKLGFTAKEIENSVPGIQSLAAATGSDLARAAEVAGATLRGFGLDAAESGRVADVMASSFSKSALNMSSFAESMKYVAPVAKAAGVSIEETTAMLGALADAGIKGSSAGTALRRILADMTKTGLPAKDALAALGEKGLTLNDAFDEVGRSAQTALLVLTENTDKVNKLTGAFESADGAAKEMADTMLNNLAGDLTIIGSAWEGFVLSLEDGSGKMNKFSRGVIQLGTEILSSATKGNSLTKLLSNWLELIQKMFSPLLKLAETFGLLSSKGSAVEMIFDAITAIFFVMTAPLRILIWSVGKLAEGIAFVVTKAYDFISSFEIVNKAIDFVADAFKGLTNTIKDFLKWLRILDSESNKLSERQGKLRAKQAKVKDVQEKLNGELKKYAKIIKQINDSPEIQTNAPKLEKFADSLDKVNKKTLEHLKIQAQAANIEMTPYSFWDRLFGMEPGKGDELRDTIIDQFGEVTNATLSFLQTNLALQSQAAEAEINIAQQKKEAINNQLDSEIAKQEEAKRAGAAYTNEKIRNLKKEKAEAEKLEKKAIADQKKIARQQKTIATSQAIINTSLAITKAYATYDAITASIISAALGVKLGLEIATIQKQKFRKGGAGVLQGNSHENGGIAFDGNKEAEGGEAFGILSKTATRKYYGSFENIVNKMNHGTFDDYFLNSQIILKQFDNQISNKTFDKMEDYLSELVYLNKKSNIYDKNGRLIRSGNTVLRYV